MQTKMTKNLHDPAAPTTRLAPPPESGIDAGVKIE